MEFRRVSWILGLILIISAFTPSSSASSRLRHRSSRRGEVVGEKSWAIQRSRVHSRASK